MYYDLDLFGKELCRIRNNLGFTQKYISEITTIHIDTIRRIENGKTTPTHDTLELLSLPLKEDLNQLLLKYRLSYYSEFDTLKNRIELKLEQGDYEHLQDELNELNVIMLNKDNDDYISKQIKQLWKINMKNFNMSYRMQKESLQNDQAKL